MEIVLLLIATPILVVAFWAMTKPETPVTILFLASTMSSVSFALGPANLRIDAVVAPIVLIAALFMKRSAPRTPRDRWRRIFGVTLAGLVALAIFSSAANAPEPIRSYFMLGNFALGGMVFFFLTPLALNWRRVVIICTWGLALLCALSIAELLIAPGATQLTAPPQGGDGYRVRGLALEPNLMATMCAGWLGVLFYWRSVLTRIYLLPACLIAAAAVLTNTRAAWVSIAITCGFALWTLRSRLVWALPAMAALVAAITVILASEIGNAERGSFGWKLLNLFASDSGTGLYRIRTWDIAFQDLSTADGYIAGLGVNSYSQRHPVDLTGAVEGYLSNVWIGWLYDGGVLALLLFVVLIVSAFMYSKNRWDAIPAFVAVLLGASLTNPLWMTFPWLILVFSTAVVEENRSRTTAPIAGGERERDRFYA
ncbi:O-antigen ligase family protein [Microbacterium marmarense]|uniref:O-antigen ligase family protein n=1 Tax=Microbacterium marmarense TaxID=3122051 RepID=A0ABU8LUR3_9MICO